MPFPQTIRAEITDADDASGRWLYAWTQREQNFDTGDDQEPLAALSGELDTNPAVEINDAEVEIGTIVHLRQRGYVAGALWWEFAYSPSGPGTGTVTSVAATAPAAGFTITGSPITTAGTFVFTLSDDLGALEALSGTNTIYYRSGASAWTAVTIGAALLFTSGTLKVDLAVVTTTSTNPVESATLSMVGGNLQLLMTHRRIYADHNADGLVVDVRFAAGTTTSAVSIDPCLFAACCDAEDLTVVASADPTAGIAPLEVELLATPTGGVGPYTYAWTVTGGTLDDDAVAGPIWTLPDGGSYTATVVITDACGRTATDTTDPVVVECEADTYTTGGETLTGGPPVWTGATWTLTKVGGGAWTLYDGVTTWAGAGWNGCGCATFEAEGEEDVVACAGVPVAGGTSCNESVELPGLGTYTAPGGTWPNVAYFYVDVAPGTVVHVFQPPKIGTSYVNVFTNDGTAPNDGTKCCTGEGGGVVGDGGGVACVTVTSLGRICIQTTPLGEGSATEVPFTVAAGACP